MKYTTSVEIDKSIDDVIQLFDNPENNYKWMDGLQSYEQLSGPYGQPGSKARMKFKMGKREIEMIETVEVRNFPEEYTVAYTAKGVFNIVKNRFKPLPNNRTEFINEQEFHFTGFMKILGFLMPGAFKKQSLKYLNDFKKFAESN